MQPWLCDKQRLVSIMKSCNLNIKAAAFDQPGRVIPDPLTIRFRPPPVTGKNVLRRA